MGPRGSAPDPPQIPPWLDRAAALAWRGVVVLVAMWLLGKVLAALWVVVVPVVLALFGATVLAPAAAWLRDKGLPPLIATWAVFLAAAGVIVGALFLLGPALAAQLSDLGDTLTTGIDGFERTVEATLANAPWGLGEIDLDGAVRRAADGARDNAAVLARGLLSGAVALIEVVAAFLLTIVITFFFVKDGDRISSRILGTFSAKRADDIREIGRRTTKTIGGYLRGVFLVGVADAAIIAIALAVLGVPLVLPLAVLTFIGAFFPFIGAVIAGLIAAVVALVVVAVTIVVQQVEGDVLAPLLIGKTLKLHPVVIMLALTTGAIVGGIFGAFIAVPLVASVAGAIDHLRRADGEVTAVDGGVAVQEGTSE